MARYDKYEPKSGGFRARLAANLSKTEPGNPIGVGLNASGLVVAGAGQTGVVGILDLHSDLKAGQVVDVMTDGDVVDMTGLVAGTVYYAAAADGVISTTNTGKRVGFTVEAGRLVVRLNRA